VSTLESREGKAFWHLLEVDAAGAQVFEGAVDLTSTLGLMGVPGDAAWCPKLVATPAGFAALFGDPDQPMTIVAIDRATFAEGGATLIHPATESGPVTGFGALAALGERFAIHFAAGEGEAKQVRVFDRSGQPISNAVTMPEGLVMTSLLPAGADALWVTEREGSDGPRGWLGVTCGVE
jgi:hypothetical protein